jgi:hypothetical protein
LQVRLVAAVDVIGGANRLGTFMLDATFFR